MCLPECPLSSSNKISVTSISLQVVFLNKMVTEYTIPVQCMDPMETYSLHTGRYVIQWHIELSGVLSYRYHEVLVVCLV